MKINLINHKNFIVNKKDLKEDIDYENVADLIHMINHNYCIESAWYGDDIKKIASQQQIYEFYDDSDRGDGELQLQIKSLKNTLEVNFFFD